MSGNKFSFAQESGVSTTGETVKVFSIMADERTGLLSASRDYERVAQAIDFIRGNVESQPTLAEVAAAVNLSEFHLQRLFTRWAGVSPKRFLQVLTVDYAKQLLAQSVDVLSTSYEVGLSGSGRLHDLFVNLEAVSPGEFKGKGKGIEIRYGFHSTPLGDCLIGQTDRGICCLEFVTEENPLIKLDRLAAKWTHAALIEKTEETAGTIRRIFDKDRSGPASLNVLVKGTNFQVKVWNALLRIPEGQLTSYSAIANWIGHPRATRAVGTAVGSNPIAYLIPCHRVLRGDGNLGGYHWGLTRKCACLIRESA